MLWGLYRRAVQGVHVVGNSIEGEVVEDAVVEVVEVMAVVELG